MLLIPLAKNNLPGLVSNLNSSAINKFERKKEEKEGVKTEKEFALFISNEDMNDIIKIIKIIRRFRCILIAGVTEAVKDEINKQEGEFLGALLELLAFRTFRMVLFVARKYRLL